jgi:hypothetical protein
LDIWQENWHCCVLKQSEELETRSRLLQAARFQSH